MKKAPSESRRKFLKASALSTASLMVASSGVQSLFGKTITAAGWPATGTMQINPDIDNLRVVYITDAAMLKSQNRTSYSDANTSSINYEVVRANMDKMAMALARKTTIPEAWSTIFRKPAAKTWQQVNVAIKVNMVGEGVNIASIAKFCEVLNGFGVPYASITVYDSGNVSGTGNYTPFKTTQLHGINIIHGDAGDTAVLGSGTSYPCVKAAKDADILINMAWNKGHDQIDKLGGISMCLKNHTGTMKYKCPDTLKEMLDENKCDVIVGGTPVKQQLCFIDSLWIGKPTSWNGGLDPNSALSTLSMGTFAGAVDYLTTKKIRTLKYPNTKTYGGRFDWLESNVNQYITGFGYTEAERVALDTMDAKTDAKGRGLLSVSTTTSVLHGNSSINSEATVLLSCAGNGMKATKVTLSVPGNAPIESVTIFSLAGEKVHVLDIPSGSRALQLTWDGTTKSGAAVRSGTYIVQVISKGAVVSGEIVVSR